MDYQQLQFFREAVKTGNITLAAKKLYVSRQTISAALTQLEEELGFSLITRGKTGVELTPDGKLFYSRIDALFQNGEKLMQDMKDYGNTYRIPVRIAITPSIEANVFMAIHRWKDSHPDYSVSIEQLDGKESTNRLIDGTLDFVFTLMPNYANSGFISDLIAEYPLYLAVHKDNPLSQKDFIEKADLAHCTIISTTLGYGELEYEGERFMPFSEERYHYIVTEDSGLLESLLIQNKGVILSHKDSVIDHIDCVRLIPFRDPYTLPVFLRTSNQTLRKQQYSSIVRELKHFMEKALR